MQIDYATDGTVDPECADPLSLSCTRASAANITVHSASSSNPAAGGDACCSRAVLDGSTATACDRRAPATELASAPCEERGASSK